LVTPMLLWVARLVLASPLLVSPWLVTTAPTGIKSLIVPTVVEVTLTVTVQLLLAEILALLTAIVVPPAAAETVAPVHVVETPGVVAICMPLSVPPEVPLEVK
jgi:hypothetical protein